MKKRFTIIYAIFATVFILGSLSFLGYNLYKEYKEGDSRTRSIFANTVYNLYSTLGDEYNSENQFVTNVSAAAGTLQDYSFYQIENNNKIVYSYPGNTPEENTTSKLTKNFSTNIEINDENYLITCNIYLLKPYSIFYYSRITFLLILGITLLTFILIIFNKDKSKSYSTTYSSLDNEDSDKLIDDDPIFDETLNQSEEIYNSSFINEQQTLPDENIKQDDNEITVDLSDDISKNTPEGLFSTTTGFGWESYLLTRLNNEINRAIASEMDISLFIIKLSNLERSNPLTKKICEYIAAQFQFRDLLFEYKEDCLVAIKTGDNLDEALLFADKLHEEISNLFNDNKYKCYIGITTRSVRMISGERFLNEAEQALSHAENDEKNPIIAFKADNEKYRKYLEQQFDN